MPKDKDACHERDYIDRNNRERIQIRSQEKTGYQKREENNKRRNIHGEFKRFAESEQLI
jgi:hypothetical protein